MIQSTLSSIIVTYRLRCLPDVLLHSTVTLSNRRSFSIWMEHRRSGLGLRLPSGCCFPAPKRTRFATASIGYVSLGLEGKTCSRPLYVTSLFLRFVYSFWCDLSYKVTRNSYIWHIALCVWIIFQVMLCFIRSIFKSPLRVSYRMAVWRSILMGSSVGQIFPLLIYSLQAKVFIF